VLSAQSAAREPALGYGHLTFRHFVVACGSADSTFTEATSTSASSSSSSYVRAGEEWVKVSDAGGLTLSLPKQVEPLATSQPAPDGRPLDMRVYQTQEDEVGVPSRSRKPWASRTTTHVLSTNKWCRAETGAKNVGLGDLRPVWIDSGQGTEATLTFKATDGLMNYWKIATHTDGSALVNVQAPYLRAETRRKHWGAVDDKSRIGTGRCDRRLRLTGEHRVEGNTGGRPQERPAVVVANRPQGVLNS
jgi:hypothetical protein